MVKLYYVPRTRSTRPRWVLEELGIPYELVRLDPKKGETRSPEHLARQPLGHVPVLEAGPVRIFESGAICYWLAEMYGDGKLMPPPGSPGRALAYQWLCFALSELEPPLALASAENRRPEDEQDVTRITEARQRWMEAVGVVDAAVRDHPYLLGKEFSVADVMVAAILAWGRAALGLEGAPAAEGYLARLRDRPAWRRAIAD